MPEVVLGRVTACYNGWEHVQVRVQSERTTRLANLGTETPHGYHTQGTRGAAEAWSAEESARS